MDPTIRKTFEGKLVSIYYSMVYRDKLRGFNNTIEKRCFILQGKKSKIYKNLYNRWVESGYLHALVPSVDRINPRLGYIKENIQFLTLRDNSAKGSTGSKNARCMTTYIGVYLDPRPNRKKTWATSLQFKGNHLGVGYHLTPLEAARAVDLKCIELGIPQKNNLIK